MRVLPPGGQVSTRQQQRQHDMREGVKGLERIARHGVGEWVGACLLCVHAASSLRETRRQLGGRAQGDGYSGTLTPSLALVRSGTITQLRWGAGCSGATHRLVALSVMGFESFLPALISMWMCHKDVTGYAGSGVLRGRMTMDQQQRLTKIIKRGLQCTWEPPTISTT